MFSTLTFIDKGYHESSDSWLQSYHFISFLMKDVAWHSQDWPKGCEPWLTENLKQTNKKKQNEYHKIRSLYIEQSEIQSIKKLS